MPDAKLSRPLDLHFGPDGKMYISEYSDVWFLDNPEAKLVQLDRAP